MMYEFRLENSVFPIHGSLNSVGVAVCRPLLSVASRLSNDCYVILQQSLVHIYPERQLFQSANEYSVPIVLKNSFCSFQNPISGVFKPSTELRLSIVELPMRSQFLR